MTQGDVILVTPHCGGIQNLEMLDKTRLAGPASPTLRQGGASAKRARMTLKRRRPVKRYLPVFLLAFLYGGVECAFLDKLWWWKSNLMVPYWLVISAALVGLAYLPERRTERALTLGLFCAFVVLDAGYWFFDRFPNYPFPVYNWWGEWWPWNSFSNGYLVGEPLPFLGVPAYYFGLGLIFALLWPMLGRRSGQSKDGSVHI